MTAAGGAPRPDGLITRDTPVGHELVGVTRPRRFLLAQRARAELGLEP